MHNVVFNNIKFLFNVLKRRPLFKNYYSSFIKYILIKYKISSDKVLFIKCSENEVDRMYIDPIDFSLILHLYVDGVITNVDCSNKLVVAFNGSLIPIEEVAFGGYAVGEALKRGWTYDLYNSYWVRNGVKFRHMHGLIIEVFDGEYDFVDVNNRVVVDVGAFIGDSAVYFALRGAKRIYAIEPHPVAFKWMLENVRLNGLEDRVVPINVALGSKVGSLKIPNISVGETGYVYYGVGSSGEIEVPMMTLSRLVEEYNIETDILKLDCEGCEFDIIFNDFASVKRFNEIILEYHTYQSSHNVEELLGILGEVFKCNVLKEKVVPCHKNGNLGLIYCRKI